MSGFINLHNHSSFSLLDGFSQVDDMAKFAAENNQSHIAITDHGNCDATLKFIKACKKHDVKAIIGCEFYVVEKGEVKVKGEKRAHLNAWAKNEKGFQNLQKLITSSNIDNFFFRPRIDPELLLEHSEGLIISTACSASFIQYEWGMKLFENLCDKQKEDIYIELMPHLLKDQISINALGLDLNKKYDVKLIATADSHYVHKEDAKSQEVVLAIQSNKRWNDPDRWKFDGDSFYLMTRRDMTKEFVNQGQIEREIFDRAMLNTLEIVEKIEFDNIEKKEVCLPKIASAGQMDDFEYLELLCKTEFDKREFKDNPIYKDRLEEELRLVKDKKFERYFLLVWDLVNWCRRENIMVGPGRGSSAGSLICLLLGITMADPIKYGLLFSRFISPERNDNPDIDLDFEDHKRPLIRKRLEELYGKWSVAGISTFSVLRGKGALRDCGRVFEVPLSEINKACATIETKLDGEEGSDHTIEESLNNFEDGKEFISKYPEVAELAIKIEGTERNRGQHAAAMIISDVDLRDGTKCSLVLGKDKEPMINWDKIDIEHMGLLKLDVLGLKMLSVLNYCRELVKVNRGIDIDFNSLPLDDKRCYKEFSKGNNVGCFQLGSPGLRKFSKQLGIDNFETLVHCTALYRPGTLHSGSTEIFVKRKNGEEDIPYQHPIIDEITKETYGIILYQESLMRIVNELAGIEWKIVDRIRKDVAKSKGVEALKKYEEMFVQGCLKQKTLREDQAIQLWSELVTFGSYSFNKSHSVVYSMITYWDMLMKIQYPQEFICALLTYGTNNKEERDEYIEEAFRLGLDIRPPKVGKSMSDRWVIDNGILYAPFIEIKGVGEKNSKAFEKLGRPKRGFVEDEPLPARFKNILDKIGAYEDKPLTDEEADVVSQYLDVSLVKNKLYKYKKLMALLNKNNMFSLLKDIDLKEPCVENKLYFGQITELNLSVRKGRDNTYTAASASFKDSSGDVKMSFAPEVYKTFTTEIEHCEGQIMIVSANTGKKAGNLRVENVWFEEDILSGDLGGLDIKVSDRRKVFNPDVEQCKECELCNQHSICNSMQGRYNVMVIGETSPPTDYQVWKEMSKHDFVQRDFHLTSFVKCNAKVKDITAKHIESCSQWFEKEIEDLKPYVVLGVGNTAVKFFRGEESGINSLNGKTEWNDRYGCYVCYCISPSALFYGGNNLIMFSDAIENFCKKVKNLGFA